MSTSTEQSKLLQVEQKIREASGQNPRKPMEIKGPVEMHVFCVVRPCEKVKKEAITLPGGDDKLVIFNPPPAIKGFTTSNFYFEKVFGGLWSIEDIFESAAQFIDSCFEGFNVFIFFYGSSGSGKTYLIRDDIGFVFSTGERVYDFLSLSIEASTWTSNVKASFWDIYKHDIIDLLTEEKDYKMHEIGHGIQVSNVIQMELKSFDDIRKVIYAANANRKKFLDDCLEEFPRLASVFQMQVERNFIDTKEQKRGSIFIVELNSSDLPHATEWGNFMTQLPTQSIKNDNYSELMDFIAENYDKPSKTVVYATISPDEEHLSESFSTLQSVSKLSAMTLMSN